MTCADYDVDNVFAKIIRSELPCKKVYYDESVLAFHDIQDPGSGRVWILVVPTKPCKDFADFISTSSDKEVAHFFDVIYKISQDHTNGCFQLISNNELGQDVFHFHFHIKGEAKVK